MAVSPQQLIQAVQNVYQMSHNNHFRYGSSGTLPPCNDGIISCDRLVSRALWDLGWTNQQNGGETVLTFPRWLPQNGFQEIYQQDQLQGGDIILFYHVDSPTVPTPAWHAFFLTSYNPANRTCCKFDAGSDVRINAIQPFNNVNFDEWTNRDFYRGYRLSGVSKGPGGVDYGQKLVQYAIDKIGKNKKWVIDYVGKKIENWSGAFVLAAAKAAGIPKSIIPQNSHLPAQILNDLVKSGGATDLGITNKNFQPGDIIGIPDVNIFQYKKKFASMLTGIPEKYIVSKLGIVEKSNDKSVTAIVGQIDGDYVKRKQYPLTGVNSKGYITIRPNWGSLNPSYSFMQTTSLYQSSSTRADATIREVCYLGNDGKPSINKTDVKLSVINYTSLLAEFAGLFGGSSQGGSYYEGSPDNVDGLPAVPRQIVQYLTGHGLNTAAAIGIIGNIRRESNFRLDAVGDHGTSFGLVQWHNDRGVRLKAACGGGDSWKTNLTGQLDFLMTELNGGYRGVFDQIKVVPNTLSGAKTASEIFVRKFEQPGDIENEVRIRNQYTEEFWNMIVVNSNSPYSSPSYESGQGIQNRQPVKSVVIPAVLDGGYTQQSGLIGDLTNYVAYYPKWKPNLGPRRVADVWNSKGRKSSHHVSTIDGYYIVAVKNRFGDNGDLIQVILEDNTKINCIIGDTKGGDAQSPWGHVFRGNLVSLIEWESYNVSSGEEMNNYLREWGIYQKKVKQIVNYGRYC